MPVFGKRVDVPGGKRGAVRQRVVLAGSAATLAGSRSVVVEDVCSTGAKLRGSNLPAAGQDIALKVGVIDLFVNVAWAQGDERGVAFDTPLDPEGVRKLKEEGRWGHVIGIV